MKGQGGQATTLKSNNPHLTGGEQKHQTQNCKFGGMFQVCMFCKSVSVCLWCVCVCVCVFSVV